MGFCGNGIAMLEEELYSLPGQKTLKTKLVESDNWFPPPERVGLKRPFS